MAIKTISLYTGSSYCKNDPDFQKRCIKATKEMARIAGQEADIVQYGGGLYGHLLDVMEEVGKVGGKMRALISPAFYDPNEQYPDYVDVVKLDDDQQRTKEFLSADGHIVTPGGDGTICEAFFSHNDNLSRLYSGGVMKPVTILNLDGYYDGLKDWFTKAVAVGYSNAERQSNLHFLKTPRAVQRQLWPK